MKLNITKKARTALRTEIKRRVMQQLPEDEHDYTSDWVYDEAIKATLEAAENTLNASSGERTP